MSQPLITCDMCPEALCCTELTIEIEEPTDLDSWGEIRWMVAHRNVSVIEQQDGSWATVFKTPCDKLLPNGNCGIYETRPMICQDYALEGCPKNGIGPLYVQRFETLEEVDEHIRDNVIPMLEEEAERLHSELEFELRKVKKWPTKIGQFKDGQ